VTSKEQEVAESVVLGGGIIGASAAYNLRKSGVDVVLVDPITDGAATAAAADVIIAMVHRRCRSMEELRHAAMQYYVDLIPELEATPSPRPTASGSKLLDNP
jgi:D-amino-acid dehydrogenase